MKKDEIINHRFDWEKYWKEYRKVDQLDADALFYQVGKTVNGKPISKDLLNLMVNDIIESLQLDSHDILIDMCCGNGLITLPLSSSVEYIYAFDFTNHLISSAIKLSHANNIQYVVGDVNDDFYKFFTLIEKPNKILMNDSLGYFGSENLRDLLKYIINEVGLFNFYITGVPNDNLKWNFYNTEERRLRYLDCVERGDITHDGIGNWWNPDQIKKICDELGLRFLIKNQPDVLSNYRSNVLIINE